MRPLIIILCCYFGVLLPALAQNNTTAIPSKVFVSLKDGRTLSGYITECTISRESDKKLTIVIAGKQLPYFDSGEMAGIWVIKQDTPDSPGLPASQGNKIMLVLENGETVEGVYTGRSITYNGFKNKYTIHFRFKNLPDFQPEMVSGMAVFQAENAQSGGSELRPVAEHPNPAPLPIGEEYPSRPNTPSGIETSPTANHEAGQGGGYPVQSEHKVPTHSNDTPAQGRIKPAYSFTSSLSQKVTFLPGNGRQPVINIIKTYHSSNEPAVMAMANAGSDDFLQNAMTIYDFNEQLVFSFGKNEQEQRLYFQSPLSGSSNGSNFLSLEKGNRQKRIMDIACEEYICKVTWTDNKPATIIIWAADETDLPAYKNFQAILDKYNQSVNSNPAGWAAAAKTLSDQGKVILGSEINGAIFSEMQAVNASDPKTFSTAGYLFDPSISIKIGN